MRDNNKIFEKYLNMQPIETNKKIDLTVKFESKTQKLAVVLFGISLLLIISGVSLQFIFGYREKHYVNNTNDDTQEVTKIYANLTSPDGSITIDTLNLNYNNETEEYEVSYKLRGHADKDEIAYKIVVKIENGEVVIPGYETDVYVNEDKEVVYKTTKNIASAKNINLEITTKEDLIKNYGLNI